MKSLMKKPAPRKKTFSPDAWEQEWQRHWRKVGTPGFELPVGGKFWEGMRTWGQFMMQAGVFTREEIGFGHITDSPEEAVDLILRSLQAPVKARLKPLP